MGFEAREMEFEAREAEFGFHFFNLTPAKVCNLHLFSYSWNWYHQY